MSDTRKWAKIKINDTRKSISSCNFTGEVLRSCISDWSKQYDVHKKNYLLYNRAYNRIGSDFADAYRQLKTLDSTYGFTSDGREITKAYREFEEYRYKYDNWRKTIVNNLRNDNLILSEIIDYLEKAKDEISNMATQTELVYDRSENIKDLISNVTQMEYTNRQNIGRIG